MVFFLCLSRKRTSHQSPVVRRLKALDLKTAAYLDETTGKIVPRSDL